MKIIIPVTSNSIEDTKISRSLGRSPYFLLLDQINKVFIENKASKATGGAGIKAAQIIIDSGAHVLITPRCGVKAGEVLDKANVKIFKSNGEDVEENLAKYRGDILEILRERE